MRKGILCGLIAGLSVQAILLLVGTFIVYPLKVSKAKSETAEAVKEIQKKISNGKYDDLKSLIKTLPEDQKAYYKGYLDYLKGNFPEASKSFEEYLAYHPKNFDIRIARAHACIHAGQTVEAIREFTEAQEIQKDNIRVIKGLGQAYLENGDLPDAINTLQPLYKQYYPDPDIYFYLGKAYLYNGEIKQAKDCFSRMYRIPEIDVEKYRRGSSPPEGLLAHAYFLSGDYPTAIETLNGTVMRYPYPSYYWALARLHELTNNLSTAISSCEKALEKNPESKEIKKYKETLEKKLTD